MESDCCEEVGEGAGDEVGVEVIGGVADCVGDKSDVLNFGNVIGCVDVKSKS